MPPGTAARQVDSRRLVDRMDPRIVTVLTVLGFGLPVAGYLWLIGHYSVNIVISDQWDDVTVIRASYHQLIPWHALWAQHNENRMFFPNLLVIALARTTHFNVQIEEVLAAVMLFAAAGLIIWTHKRRSPDTPWLYYCPAAFLLLTIAQYENTLWGFQIAWYMILLALALALYVLDKRELSRLGFATAGVAAFVGSLSSSQGLLIWGAGLVLLYHRRRSWPYLATWIVAASVTAALYFRNFDMNRGQIPGYASSHPLAALKFFIYAIGDIVGVQTSYGRPPNIAVILFGICTVVLAIGCIVVYGIRRDAVTASPVGIALIVTGLLFAAAVTKGRAAFSYWAAGASRYVTFDLLVLLGIYLTVLGRRRRTGEASPDAVRPGAGGLMSRLQTLVDLLPDWGDRVALRSVGVVTVLAIAIQVAVGIPHALQGARSDHVYQAEAVPVLRNIDQYSNGQVVIHLYVFNSAPYLRAQARTLKEHQLSIFSGGKIWP